MIVRCMISVSRDKMPVIILILFFDDWRTWTLAIASVFFFISYFGNFGAELNSPFYKDGAV